MLILLFVFLRLSFSSWPGPHCNYSPCGVAEVAVCVIAMRNIYLWTTCPDRDKCNVGPRNQMHHGKSAVIQLNLISTQFQSMLMEVIAVMPLLMASLFRNYFLFFFLVNWKSTKDWLDSLVLGVNSILLSSVNIILICWRGPQVSIISANIQYNKIFDRGPINFYSTQSSENFCLASL